MFSVRILRSQKTLTRFEIARTSTAIGITACAVVSIVSVFNQDTCKPQYGEKSDQSQASLPYLGQPTHAHSSSSAIFRSRRSLIILLIRQHGSVTVRSPRDYARKKCFFYGNVFIKFLRLEIKQNKHAHPQKKKKNDCVMLFFSIRKKKFFSIFSPKKTGTRPSALLKFRVRI